MNRLFLAAFLAACWSAQAGLEVSDIFGDDMVIQRDREIPVWGQATAGAAIQVTLAGQEQSATAGQDGSWSVKFPAREAGGPYDLAISGDGESRQFRNVLVGDVWLCSGQSNMAFRMSPNPPWSFGVLDYETEIANSSDPDLRVFRTATAASMEPESFAHGVWLRSEPRHVSYFSALAYYFGRELRRELKVPIGIIMTTVGGTVISSWTSAQEGDKVESWKSKREKSFAKATPDAVAQQQAKLPAYWEASVKSFREGANAPSFPEPYKNFKQAPSALYNSMIHPFTSFPVKGFLWYQGESDNQSADQYEGWLKTMITSWRQTWNQPEAPFLVVQLTGYDPVAARDLDSAKYGLSFASLREAQRRATSLPHTALVVSADLGDEKFIHPRDKRTIGIRAGQAAMVSAYGQPGLPGGPVLSSAKLDQGRVIAKFDSNGGLRDAAGTKLESFEIAGSDGVFHPAEAEIIADGEIALRAEGVSQPAQLRYAFLNYPKLTLFDRQGSPAAPFVAPVAQP